MTHPATIHAKVVIAFSGGIQSWTVAKRLAKKYGPDQCHLLFCDTHMEDPDCYRFLTDAQQKLQIPLTTISDGRTPWEIFRDVHLLGDWQRDPCSRILKRELTRKWLQQNVDPDQTAIALGFGWEEQHRHGPARRNWWPYQTMFPLMWQPWLTKCQMLELAEKDGLRPQRMYALGFTHSNCGGFCCKAGLRHYAHLLNTWPEIFARHEAEEKALQKHLNYPATFLSRQIAKKRIRLTMTDFRTQYQNGQITVDDEPDGGCGCFE
jgi:hypothetical protein